MIIVCGIITLYYVYKVIETAFGLSGTRDATEEEKMMYGIWTKFTFADGSTKGETLAEYEKRKGISK